MRKRYFLPNAFTVFNLLCGFLAMVSAVESHLLSAGWLIVLAGVFDALDGRIARSTHACSEFGMEADSLSDLISFGAAPSLLSYQVGLKRLGHMGLVICFLPLLFSTLRLARFNVQLKYPEQKSSFTGLPAPASGLALAAFAIAYSKNQPLRDSNVLAAVVVLVSVLMISTVKYRPLPRLSLRAGSQNTFGLAYVSGWVVLSLLRPGIFMFPMWMVYVLSGPFTWISRNIQVAAGARKGEEGVRKPALREYR